MDKSNPSFFRRIIKKKRTWVILSVVVILILYFTFRTTDNSKNTVSDIVKYVDLKQTVLATGQVTSNTDLDLSFSKSGVVKSVKVKVGDTVKQGQVLATLEQGSELASLTSARGALAAANARLKRTMEGASNEEIALANLSLANAKRDFDNTKISQDTLIQNSYSTLLNSTPEAVPTSGASDSISPTISGNYALDKEGDIIINTYSTGGGSSFSVSGLVSGNGTVTTTTPQPLGNSGLYIKFPSTTNLNSNGSGWTISIPNKKASNYLTNLNAYESALKTQQSVMSSAQSLVDQRQAELTIKTATARSSDIDLAKADIVSAEGQMQAALANYNNTIITAPADGTITKVDIKLGELATAQKEVMVLQDVSNIYLEANINEANVTSVVIGMPVDITFDAISSEKTFKGFITYIDPSSTVVSGVVNYKIKASVEKVAELRPGMTANMTIKSKEKDHVLVVQSRAILTDKSGNKTIRVVTNPKTKTFKEEPVTTGLEGDGGMVEIQSGVNEGDEFVVLIKS